MATWNKFHQNEPWRSFSLIAKLCFKWPIPPKGCFLLVTWIRKLRKEKIKFGELMKSSMSVRHKNHEVQKQWQKHDFHSKKYVTCYSLDLFYTFDMQWSSLKSAVIFLFLTSIFCLEFSDGHFVKTHCKDMMNISSS